MFFNETTYIEPTAVHFFLMYKMTKEISCAIHVFVDSTALLMLTNGNHYVTRIGHLINPTKRN